MNPDLGATATSESEFTLVKAALEEDACYRVKETSHLFSISSLLVFHILTDVSKLDLSATCITAV